MGQKDYTENSGNPLSELKAVGLIALAVLPALVVAIGFVANITWSWIALMVVAISFLATFGIGLWLTGILGRMIRPPVEQERPIEKSYDQKRYEESWATSITPRRSADRWLSVGVADPRGLHQGLAVHLARTRTAHGPAHCTRSSGVPAQIARAPARPDHVRRPASYR